MCTKNNLQQFWGKKKKSRRTFYFDVDNRGLIQDRTLKREREKETDCVPVCVCEGKDRRDLSQHSRRCLVPVAAA